MAQTGQAAIWGTGGSTFTGVVINPTVGEVEDTNFTRESDIEELRSGEGDTVGLSYFDLRKKGTITVKPSADSGTRATAYANASAMLPAPGTAITLVDSHATVLSATHSGKYVVDTSSIRRSNRGYATIEMAIRQHDATDVSAPVT